MHHTHLFAYYWRTTNLTKQVELSSNAIKGSFILTEERNVMVNSEDILGTTDVSNVIDGLSHKPMSL